MKERARTLFAIKGGILEFLTKPPTFEWTPSRDLASLGKIIPSEARFLLGVPSNVCGFANFLKGRLRLQN